MQTKIDRILSIFNQKFLFNEENKWLLSYQENVEDEDLKLFLKRLSLAADYVGYSICSPVCLNPFSSNSIFKPSLIKPIP